MEQTWLTRRVRRAIMIGLIAVFFLAAPSVVLYTAGYRYNWQLKRLDQAGSFSIDIEPKDARIFINDHLVQKELPIRLNNMTPGTYVLRIERTGKKTWEKEVTIESKKTTYIKHITLFAEAMPTLLVP